MQTKLTTSFEKANKRQKIVAIQMAKLLAVEIGHDLALESIHDERIGRYEEKKPNITGNVFPCTLKDFM